MLLFTAYVLQQRFAPFLSLRAFHAAVVDVGLNPGLAGAAAAAAPSALHRRRTRGNGSDLVKRRRSWFEPDVNSLAQLRKGSVLYRLRVEHAVLLAGLTMQKVMADYNNLESTYLITALPSPSSFCCPWSCTSHSATLTSTRRCELARLRSSRRRCAPACGRAATL
jgi:hypothetical protein